MAVVSVRVEVSDPSGVGEARRRAAELARTIGFAKTDIGRVSLIVTEAASNVVKHAGRGELLMHIVEGEQPPSIALLILDRGPGIRDLGEALRDGYSSSGTRGTGLGAILRVASGFDLYSRAGGGTAVFACVRPEATPAPKRALAVGAVNVPHPMETVCGDAWAVRAEGSRTFVLVADGLGHGECAHVAAQTAKDVFCGRPLNAPGEILQEIHAALRATRGAAVGVTAIDSGNGVVRFAGLGNIGGTIVNDGSTRSLVSQNGTAGYDMRRIQEFTYPWERNAVLVLHSDGLLSHWVLDNYPGLLSRHPMLAAGILYRDFSRGRDDVTVVVLREDA